MQRRAAIIHMMTPAGGQETVFWTHTHTTHCYHTLLGAGCWRDNEAVSPIEWAIAATLMNSTEVQNPQRKLDVFGSVLACAKPANVFQKLSYSLCGLCLSLSSLIPPPQTISMFHCVLRLPNSSIHRAFLFFDAKAWQQSQTDLFTCTTVLHGEHRPTPLRRIDLM